MPSLRVLTATALISLAAAASAAPPLTLARQPLFLVQTVEPNLLVTLDDSYSMRSAFLPGSLDSSQNVWLQYTASPSGSNDVQRCGWQIPRFYSPDTNTMYYNPDVSYAPPLRADGTPFPDADFNAAWVDGISANTGGTISAARVVDLATGYFPTYELNLPVFDPTPEAGEYDPRDGEYVVQHHLVVRHTDDFVSDTTNYGSCNDDENAEWRLPFGAGEGAAATSAAFYYRYKASAPRRADGSITLTNQRSSWNFELHAVSAAERRNFANWYSYYRTRYLAAKSTLTFSFAERVAGVRIAWQNQEQNFLVPGVTQMRDYDTEGKAAFFDWLFSHRMYGDTPTRRATIRAGQMLGASPGASDSTNLFWDPHSQRQLSCRTNYHLIVTDGYWNENPLDASAAPQHDRLATAIPEYPEMNYAPGGGYQNSQKIFWKEDVGGTTPSLADIAFHYWATDARQDLEDRVPPRWLDLDTGVTTDLPPPATSAEAAANAETFWNPKNDPARHQHLVNYAISLGQDGNLKWSADPAMSDYTRLRKGELSWPYVWNSSATGIDDLWHAAVNSRGEYFLADDPQELAQSLSRFLEIVNEQRGTAAAATVSSGVSTAKTLAFRAGYDTVGWTGFVEAYRYLPDGTLQMPPLWNAADALSSDALDPDARVILTSAQPRGGGIPFRWDNLPEAYRDSLDVNPATDDDDGLGRDRLQYLRGDSSLEADHQHGQFRIRRNRLGAIAHASTVLVAAPSGGYDDGQWPEDSAERLAAEEGHGYAQFVAQYKNRRRQLIVGANDGMLHAFDAGFAATDDAGDGGELWAYVPREVAARLPQLTRRGIYFEPFVDASVVVRDAYLGAGRGWRTVLVGGLRRGGQGFFALDVTDPAAIEEARAADTVLWEFSDDVTGAQDLGYSYGAANISRLHHGGWAAVVPGGYNSHEPDAATGGGQAALFVLDLATGEKLREFDIVDASGLGPVTMGDLEGDGIDDFAVAGTLEGDVYLFDLSAATAEGWPEPRLLFRGERDADGRPMRPVTSAPRIFGDSATGQALVLFGTGKMLEPGDPAIETPQAFYAVRMDGGSYPVTQADLAARTLSRHGENDAYFSIAAAGDASAARGWYFLLGGDARDQGERIISAAGAHFSSGAVLISSIVPNGGDPCRGDLRGNFYVLDASNGGALGERAIADSDGDGDIDADDRAVGVALDRTVPGGTPAIVEQIGGGIAHIPDVPGVELPTPTWRRRNQGELQ